MALAYSVCQYQRLAIFVIFFPRNWFLSDYVCRNIERMTVFSTEQGKAWLDINCLIPDLHSGQIKEEEKAWEVNLPSDRRTKKKTIFVENQFS